VKQRATRSFPKALLTNPNFQQFFCNLLGKRHQSWGGGFFAFYFFPFQKEKGKRKGHPKTKQKKGRRKRKSEGGMFGLWKESKVPYFPSLTYDFRLKSIHDQMVETEWSLFEFTSHESSQLMKNKPIRRKMRQKKVVLKANNL
jgi:hypothetical protein